MNRRDFELLGKCFEADVRGGEFPVYQTKSKRMEALRDQGLVTLVEIKTASGPFKMTVSGWRLTKLGHLTFCMEC